MPPLVLICDNEAPLRTLLRESLAGEGYDILEARDGDESIALARERRPDVVVLDLRMPGRSGVEVLTELRADEALRDTPVLVLTARAQAQDRAEAERAGASLFVTKPFSPLGLADAVAELLEKR